MTVIASSELRNRLEMSLDDYAHHLNVFKGRMLYRDVGTRGALRS